MEIDLIANEEVRFTVNDKELNGILTRPYSDAPCLVMVLLQGAGRAGVNDPYYVEHTEQLIRSGFAPLRSDGSGWGGGALKSSGYETLTYRTEEARVAVRYLQFRPDIKADEPPS